jgi:hypothetical protein
MSAPTQGSLAIIGAGSAGLITLKTALDQLKGWDIQCFEKGGHIRGAWGHPYPGFISTSTKFTTQFACYPKFSDAVGSEQDFGEFFREREFGDYLETFANEFQLLPHIKLHTEVSHIQKCREGWTLSFAGFPGQTFTHLIICTGLVQRPRQIESELPLFNLKDGFDSVVGQKIVVMGGGESAADIASRLAAPQLNNQVFLSLRSGIRVSPRYHPIRGVPSDFLRNRLMLSIRQDLRNRIGQKFVESRIKFRGAFERLFPGHHSKSDPERAIASRRRQWDLKLTSHAKDKLFNMFHNKSDGFLDAVGEERIRIIGPPVDAQHKRFHSFERDEAFDINPDLLCPMIGYRVGFTDLFAEPVQVTDFYRACLHVQHSNLFLVGFTRPIIGNIPSISEVQARYVIGHISGNVPRPEAIEDVHAADRKRLEAMFPALPTDIIYPVEMFPYCDELARATQTYPTLKKLGLARWLKIQLITASTQHYLNPDFDSARIEAQSIYTPHLLNLLLSLVKVFDLVRPKRSG